MWFLRKIDLQNVIFVKDFCEKLASKMWILPRVRFWNVNFLNHVILNKLIFVKMWIFLQFEAYFYWDNNSLLRPIHRFLDYFHHRILDHQTNPDESIDLEHGLHSPLHQIHNVQHCYHCDKFHRQLHFVLLVVVNYNLEASSIWLSSVFLFLASLPKVVIGM